MRRSNRKTLKDDSLSYVFKNSELWSLNSTLSDVIYCGLKQFRDLDRLGVPGGLLIDNVWYMSSSESDKNFGKTVKEKIRGKTYVSKYISLDEMTTIWNKILDDMILAFKITAKESDVGGYLISISDNDEKLSELYFLTEEERKIKFAEAMENLNRVLRETKGISIKDIPSQK